MTALATTDETELKDPGYELFMAALSVLAIVNLVLQYVVRDAVLDGVLLAMNGLLSLIFFVDFLYRLFTATSKSQYFLRGYGWADLLSSLPVQELKVLRLFRLVRVARLLRARGVRVVGNRLLRNRAGSALLSLLLMGILVLEFGSLWMLRLEQYAPDAKITTPSDSLWYTIVTISTVGYGDEYPVTTGGRILGAVVIVIGVGIFGTFTGYLANLFLAPKPPPPPEAVVDTRERLARLRAMVLEQQAAIDELDGLLAKEARERDG